MRLGSVLSEALRNIGSGVSRAFAMFLAVLLSGTLLGGYEAMTVITWNRRPCSASTLTLTSTPSSVERWMAPHATGCPTLAME